MCDHGFISDMQHFSTGDGEGIRTTIFMQGCNLSCLWCHNPETIDIVSPQNALKLSGKKYELGHVMDYILEDIKFYKKSNGGVTISGGEPLLQIDFCVELAKECFKKGISVIIDTAANVPFEYFQRIIPYTKTFFFDYKANSEEEYRVKIGGSYKLMLANLEGLIALGCDVVVRIPIVPGHNDRLEYMEETAIILKGIGVEKVQLLPFHRLGTAKYKALGKEYFYAETKPVSQEKSNELLSVLESYDFVCKIDG